jgi:hypothetical protein
VAIGILLFASSSPRGVALTTFGTIMGGFLLGAVLVRTGVYKHSSLVTVVLHKPWMWDAGIVLVMVLYGAAYAVGRLIRREQTIGSRTSSARCARPRCATRSCARRARR